ncbi:MAG: protein translocase subunit SecF [Hyphomonadaceae bacterium]|nr:protein translocase subunit SecF [Hyphomonadaceae bacterium]
MRFPFIRYLPERTNFKFVSVAGLMGVLSTLLIIASFVSMFTAGFRSDPVTLYNQGSGSVMHRLGHVLSEGFNLGVDFKGGTLIELHSSEPIDLGQVRAAVSDLGLGDVQVQSFGQDENALVRFENEDVANPVAEIAAVRAHLAQVMPNVTVARSETVGAQVSEELFTGGLTALGLAIVLMLVYIWFRFEWQFGVGAILGLFHDVILTLGLFSVLRMEFTLTIIAALLTIIGYGINDTVVVFDRLRENLRKYKKMPLGELVDLTINETLSRTIMTGVTALMSLVVLYFLGGEALSGFAIAMIFGIIVGTYSSVYVAAPAILIWGVKRGREGDKRAEAPQPVA